jgi:hypothetical protein
LAREDLAVVDGRAQKISFAVCKPVRPGFNGPSVCPYFDWLAANPAQASLFNGTMIGFHGMEPPAIAAAYDFSRFHIIADVGGSTGNLLATILAHHPRPHGIVFDLPHVVHEATAVIAQRGLSDRIRIEAGSFFESVPGGADAYILWHMNSGGHLLIVEMDSRRAMCRTLASCSILSC